MEYGSDVAKNLVDTMNSAYQSETSIQLAQRSNRAQRIRLVDVGEKKICVIREIRECYSRGMPNSEEIDPYPLREAKAVVDSAPTTIYREVHPSMTVHEVKRRLEDAGATVKLV
jgi:ribosomal protein L7/L12